MRDMNGMPLPQTGTTPYHAQLGLTDKDRAIKGLVVCNDCDLEPLIVRPLFGTPKLYDQYMI